MTLSSTDILITGDSFCQHRSEKTHWPFILHKSLTNLENIPCGSGFGGCSFWSYREDIYKNIIGKKLVIICHTNKNRLPTIENKPFNPHSSAIGKEWLDYIHYYYINVYNEDFHKWVYLNWLNELDELLIKNNIDKVIHLDFSKNTLLYYKENNVFNFSKGCIVYHSFLNKNFNLSLKLPNHYDYKTQLKLSNFLFKIIEEYDDSFYFI